MKHSVLVRIISGGQTGVDRAALEVAKELGIATGGWAPKGWRIDGGTDPSLEGFGPREHSSSYYPARTAANVCDADATIMFGDVTSPGCALTVRLCQKYQKPLLVNPTAPFLREWLRAHGIKTLNVAGNRLRINPTAARLARQVLLEALG